MAQILQSLSPFEHLLYGIRAEQIVIDEIQLIGISTSVTLRPFLRITDGSDTPQVNTRHKISGIILFYQIGKRQIGCIGMIDMTSHHQ